MDESVERVDLRPGGEWVDLGEGRQVWNRLTIRRTPNGDEPEVRADVEVRYDGVPECREVRILTVGAGRPVRARDLRAFRLDDLIEAGFGLAVMQPAPLSEMARRHGVSEGDWVTGSTGKQSDEAIRHLRKKAKNRRVTDELLRAVAEVYRANVDRNPTQAVREHFDKAPSTAALYVQLARKRTDPATGARFLGAAIKGKAGEQ